MSKVQLQNKIIHSNVTNFVYPKSKQQNDSNKIFLDLPTKSEILNKIIDCKNKAIKTVSQFGFKVRNNSNLLSCEIAKLSLCKQKKKINAKAKSVAIGPLKLNDLENVSLKNFVEKHPNPDERSPFVKLHYKKVVKKTSLCWLLRNDCQKLSSDRTRRVMAK